MDENFRVVVVDDMPEAADALGKSLRMDGYEVVVAYEALGALAAIGEQKPLCVLLDIDMPGIDGVELSRQLRISHGDDIVLIAITGWGDSNERVSAGFANFDYYLRKPIDFAALAKLLPPLTR